MEDTEKLNIKKLFWVFTIIAAFGLFITSLSLGNGILLALFGSVIFAVPVGWLVSMCFAVIVEGAKLFKPILKWFLEWILR
jgi:hypothetical protein